MLNGGGQYAPIASVARQTPITRQDPSTPASPPYRSARARAAPHPPPAALIGIIRRMNRHAA
ncbi:MAG: hypothetical protein NZ701_09535, partial [Roseiflexus sp.]|nr:hypothetical protein [Roseiflexus sp.]